MASSAPSGTGAEMTFSGKPNVSSVTIAIVNSETGNGSDNDASDGSRFNLVGNPYPLLFQFHHSSL